MTARAWARFIRRRSDADDEWMKLVRETDVALQGPSTVFGHGRVAPCVVAAGCTAALGCAAWFAPEGWRAFLDLHGFGRCVALAVGSVAALVVLAFTWMSFALARAALRPSNWVLKVGPDGVCVKLRSYLNAHFDSGDEIVACLPAASIARAMPHDERVSGASSESATRVARWIDLELAGTDTSALAAACAAERTRPAPERHFLFVTWRTRFRDEPVSVPRPGVVRVQRVDARMTKALAAWMPFDNAITRVLDLSQGPLEERVRALCRRGESFEALRLVRDETSVSLADARAYVDALERETAA